MGINPRRFLWPLPEHLLCPGEPPLYPLLLLSRVYEASSRTDLSR
jgi:hypothetical protein